MKTEMAMLGQVFLAFLLGAIIGFEREFRNSSAGIRTYSAVCMGACVFGLASIHPFFLDYYQANVDPTRIAAQVASGIGFIGAGVIFKEGLNTIGLTTAATLWVTAGLGLIISFRMYLVSVLVVILMLLLLLLPQLLNYKKIVGRRGRSRGRTSPD